MKVKVSKDKLYNAILARVEADKKDYAKAVLKYQRDFEAARKKVIGLLTDTAVLLKSASPSKAADLFPFERYGRGSIDWPQEPTEPRGFADLLSKLDMCVDDTLEITDKDDYFRFLYRS